MHYKYNNDIYNFNPIMEDLCIMLVIMVSITIIIPLLLL